MAESGRFVEFEADPRLEKNAFLFVLTHSDFYLTHAVHAPRLPGAPRARCSPLRNPCPQQVPSQAIARLAMRDPCTGVRRKRV